jgi:hypothetical protein
MNYLRVRPRIEEVSKLIFVVGPVSEKWKSMFNVPKWDNWCIPDLWSSVCNHEYVCYEKQTDQTVGTDAAWQQVKVRENTHSVCKVEPKMTDSVGAFRGSMMGQTEKLADWTREGELFPIRVRMANRMDSLNGAGSRQYVSVSLRSRCTYKWHIDTFADTTCIDLSSNTAEATPCSKLWRDANITRRMHPTVQMLQHLWTLPWTGEGSSGAPKPYATTTFYICYDSCLWSNIYIYFISSPCHRCQWALEDHIYVNPSATH